MTAPPPPPPTSLDLEVSPSKARYAQRLTTQWAQVDSFLATVTSSQPSLAVNTASTSSHPDQEQPPSPLPLHLLERNETTLAHLQSLMHANHTANARRRTQHDAEVKQLKVYEAYDLATRDAPERQLLREVEAAMDEEGQKALKEVSQGAVQLGYMPSYQSVRGGGVEWNLELGRRIIELTTRVFEVEQQVAELERLKEGFEREAEATREKVEEVRDEVESETAMAEMEVLRMQTAQFNRETKQIGLKMGEYADRIAGLERHVRDLEGEVSLDKVREIERRVERRRETVKRLEGRLMEYGGLPPDVEAGRKEVRRAQEELEMWKRKREDAFAEVGAG